jgi:hypothetical protein
VEAAILALARQPGLPLAVFLMGEPLLDPGAVAGHPAQKIAEILPRDAWIFALMGEEEAAGWGWPEVSA